MRWLVNHQLTPIQIQPKSKSLLSKSVTKDLNVLPLYCLPFSTSKNKDLQQISKSAYIEISLDLKVYFSLVTCKINNLIALRSTNQTTKIFAPWWLEYIISKNIQTSKINKNTKKVKETKEKKRISPENRLKK